MDLSLLQKVEQVFSYIGEGVAVSDDNWKDFKAQVMAVVRVLNSSGLQAQ